MVSRKSVPFLVSWLIASLQNLIDIWYEKYDLCPWGTHFLLKKGKRLRRKNRRKQKVGWKDSKERDQ